MPSARTMKTTYRSHYGPPDALSLREVPVPSPKAGQILVRVRATTVNRTDCGGLRGSPFVFRFFAGFPRPRFVATGTDFAGDVEAVGAGVQRFSVGDRVFGFHDHGLGTHAQFVCVAERTPMARIPDGVSYEDAAACTEGAHYARNMLRTLDLPPGSHVLVIGGTGGIGSALIQLLRHRDVQVTAVCAGPHQDLVSALGASRVLDATQQDFVQVLTGEGVQFDHVVDAVGKSRFPVCRPLMKPNARYLSSELGPHAENITLALAAPVLAWFQGGRRVLFPVPFDCQATLDAMHDLLAQGAFRPLIDRRFPLAACAEAFRYVESGQKLGNVVLTMD